MQGNGKHLPSGPTAREYQTESRNRVENFGVLAIRKEVGAFRRILPSLVAPSTLPRQSQVKLRDQAWLVAVLT